ncbi:MAG TPA: lysophospholipid acyltransferase family protein [Burkholderiales bacterium]
MTTAPTRPLVSSTTRRWLRLRYWRAWAPLLALRTIALLPLSLSRALGMLLGALMYSANAKRRRIARINLALCFPELDDKERARLLRRHFRVAGQSYLDVAFLAWASERRFRRKVRIVGLEHLRAALARGRRVILLAPHCLGMNVGGVALGREARVFSMIKLQRQPLVDWLLQKVRTRYGAPLVAREQGLRPVLRQLAQGLVFYYLPDEDFGPRRSVFAPFFGVPTATLPTLGRLAALAQADVIPCFTRLLPGGRGYEVVLDPPLASFPTGDPAADAARMNEALERGIRHMPEQYMWTLRLFQTRPHGAPSPYA